MTTTDLRSTGKEIAAAEKQVFLIQKDIAELEGRAARKGQPTGAYDNRILEKRAALLKAQEEYDRVTGRLKEQGVDVDQARAAAPKHNVKAYREDTTTGINSIYDGGERGVTGIVVGRSSTTNRQGQETVTERTVRTASGELVKSDRSLKPGAYGPGQNPVVVQYGRNSTASKVRAARDNNQTYDDPLYRAREQASRASMDRRLANRPIGQRTTGEFIYAADAKDVKGNSFQMNYIVPSQNQSYGRTNDGSRARATDRALSDSRNSLLVGATFDKVVQGTVFPFNVPYAPARQTQKEILKVLGGEGLRLAKFAPVIATKEYLGLRTRIQQSNQLINVENAFFDIAASNERMVNKFVDKLPFKSYGKQEVRAAGNIALVYPSSIISGSIKQVREVPETIPLAYAGGKVAGYVFEGSQFLAARAASATAGEGVFLRTTFAGINKGVSAVPYLVGGVLVTDVGAETLSKKNDTARAQYLGTQAPGFVGFVAGDLSVRGKAQQAILKGYVKLTGAKEIPANTIAEQSVIDFYEKGNVPGAMKFSEIPGYVGKSKSAPMFSEATVRSNLASNRAMFEKATFLSPTYNQRVVSIDVPNAVGAVDPFIVPKNPSLTVTTRTPAGKVKNYDVITATQSGFPSETTVLRGTSRQAGLYVAPTGQAQLYFLGLGKEAGYSVGTVGYAEPGLVRIRNIKGYSEELVPLFKQEGQGNTKLSDEFLRSQAKPKTAYVDSRTYYGETPEVQAVLPEGTPLKQQGLSGVQKFFGFKEFIKVDDTIIPLRQFTALTKKVGPEVISVRRVVETVKNSESYGRYTKTIDPLRSSSVMAFRDATPLWTVSSSKRSTSRSSSVVPVSASYSPSSDVSNFSSRSVRPSSASFAGSSRSYRGSTRLSTASSTSNSNTSGSSMISRVLGRSGSSRGNRSPPTLIPPSLQPPEEFGKKKKRGLTKESKKSRFDRLFAYTPTLAGTEFETSIAPGSFSTGLTVRPVYLKRVRA